MINIALGETRKISYEWAQELERNSATLTASAWEYDGTATLASDSVTGTKASVLFTPTTDGILTNSAVLSDGQTLFEQWEVFVV